MAARVRADDPRVAPLVEAYTDFHWGYDPEELIDVDDPILPDVAGIGRLIALHVGENGESELMFPQGSTKATRSYIAYDPAHPCDRITGLPLDPVEGEGDGAHPAVGGLHLETHPAAVLTHPPTLTRTCTNGGPKTLHPGLGMADSFCHKAPGLEFVQLYGKMAVLDLTGHDSL